MSLISDMSNPILSGSSPTLTCIVELYPSVDVPIKIEVAWTSPDGTVVTPRPGNSDDNTMVMRSVTHYTSKLRLSDFDKRDAGLYTCSVNLGKGIHMSVQKNLQIGQSNKL